MTNPSLFELGEKVEVMGLQPNGRYGYGPKTAIYLGPVPHGHKHRFARFNAKLDRWVGYTALDWHARRIG